MALTVTARGTSSNNVSQTGFAVVPSGTIAVGSLGVIVMAVDNSGASGSTKVFTQATLTDSVGNTWTRRLDEIYDPGAAGAGVEIAAYTGVVATQITTSNNVTFTLGTASQGKTACMWEVVGNSPIFVDAGASCSGCTSGQTSTTPSVVTSSIANGNVVIGIVGVEGNAAVTADSDVLNGSWSAIQTQGLATPMQCNSQAKVVTGTGAQTYNLTITSADWEAGWVQIIETAASSIKTILGLAKASVKTVNDLAIASVKTVDGLA